MEKLKNILHIIFEKYGWLKLIGSLILGALFLWLFERTGIRAWQWVALPFGIYAGIVIASMLVFAWIINPIMDLREKRKKSQK